MGEGSHILQDQGQVLHRQRHSGRARAHEVRPRRQTHRTVGSGDDQRGREPGNRPGLPAEGRRTQESPPIEPNPPNLGERLSLDLHQGGIVDTPSGEWWGFSMQDHNSVGRLTSLSPVTWENGWPYFGLPGNLRRTPSTWVKPNTGHVEPDHFSLRSQRRFLGPEAPDGVAVESRSGRYQVVALRASGLSAFAFASGHRFLVGAELADAARHRAGIDRHHGVGRQRPQVRRRRRTGAAELAVRVDRTDARRQRVHDRAVRSHHRKDRHATAHGAPHVWLRVHCNFDTEISQVQLQLGWEDYKPLGPEFVTVFQLTTFQGVRYALFNYNTGERRAGRRTSTSSPWTSRGRAGSPSRFRWRNPSR